MRASPREATLAYMAQNIIEINYKTSQAQRNFNSMQNIRLTTLIRIRLVDIEMRANSNRYAAAEDARAHTHTH